MKKFVDGRLKLFLDKNTDINTFENLYNKNELKNANLRNDISSMVFDSDKFEKLQLKFGQRLRDSKNLVGRDYYKNETSVSINSIKTISLNVYEIDAMETTKLYFKSFGNDSNFEAYSDEHIFKVAKVNNKYVFLNESMPNSLIGADFSNINIEKQVDIQNADKDLVKKVSSRLAAPLAPSYNSYSASKIRQLVIWLNLPLNK